MGIKEQMRNKSISRAWPIILLAIIIAVPSQSFAAPIGATAMYVRGVAHVTSAKTGKKTRIRRGAAFAAGDKIVTSRTGVVEIKFDNGNKVRVDRNSSLLVKELRRDSSGSTFSVFNLFFGRVKSAVGRLATASSKFEYHTKAAIAGVAGTPDWVLEYKDDTLKAYLLGQPGDKGAIYIKGFDPHQTLIEITAGTWSSTRVGLPPMPPKVMSIFIRRQLNKNIPFSAEGSQSKEGGSQGKGIVTDNISRRVSSPKAASLGESKTQKGVNYMTTPKQGAIGQESQTGEQTAPPVATFNVKINFK